MDDLGLEVEKLDIEAMDKRALEERLKVLAVAGRPRGKKALKKLVYEGMGYDLD